MSTEESEESLRSLKSTVLPSLIRYRKLVETSADGIAVADSYGKILLANQQKALLLGFEKVDEIIGTILYNYISPKDRPHVCDDFKKARNSDSIRNEYRFIKKNGTIIPIELRIALISRKEQKAPNFILIARDITERAQAKEMEEELQEKRRLAALGQLAAGIAHELNTPLANISLTIEIITNLIEKKNFDSNLILRQLKVLETQSDFCSDIVNNLLLFSREIIISPTTFNISSLMAEIISYPTISQKLEELSIKPILIMEKKIDIIGDKGLLIQVFQNIILNSIDAFKLSQEEIIDPKIIITVQVLENSVKISIEDNGKGIQKEDLPRIFEPFFSTKKVGQGTGLGLSISKGIIEKHAGQISVASTAGKGTKVIVTLPRDISF